MTMLCTSLCCLHTAVQSSLFILLNVSHAINTRVYVLCVVFTVLEVISVDIISVVWFLPLVSRSSVCDSWICVQGQLARVPPSSPSTGYGVLLQPRPGSCGECVHQRSGVLCLPSGPRHGVSGLQKGNHTQQFSNIYKSINLFWLWPAY